MSEDTGNKKLAYSGQRLAGMVDCIESQGPQWTVVLQEEVEWRIKRRRKRKRKNRSKGRKMEEIEEVKEEEKEKLPSVLLLEGI